MVSYLDSFSDLSSTVTIGTDLQAEISFNRIFWAKSSYLMLMLTYALVQCCASNHFQCFVVFLEIFQWAAVANYLSEQVL